MEKKNKVTKDKIIEWYMNAVSNSEKPDSISSFAQENNFKETYFYKHYTSFKDLEKSIFGVFVEETLQLLFSTEDYHQYTAKNKLLSFYFTFFELLTANKTYVLSQLKDCKSFYYNRHVLRDLRTSFISFINDIDIEKLDFKNEKANTIQDKTYAEGYWLQFLMILNFWVTDESSNFEKTDIFIEKCVKASFDIQQIAPVKSVVDLVKFLWKEKVSSI